MKLGPQEIKPLLALLILASAILYFFCHPRVRDWIQGLLVSARSKGAGKSRLSDAAQTSAEHGAARKKAMELVRNGDVLAAARLYESAGLLREAVSVLEDASLIHEACEILIRIGRPGRAGAVFARNKRHVEAAEQYLLANMADEAAVQFMAAARTDEKYFQKAGEVYEALQRMDLAVRAYAMGRDFQKATNIAVAAKHFDELLEFMNEDGQCASVFINLDKQGLDALFADIKVDALFLSRAVKWVRISGKTQVVAQVLKKLSRDKILLSNFWFQIPKVLAAKTVAEIVQAVKPDSPTRKKFLVQNARALYDASLFDLSAELYWVSERHAMAAKTFTMSLQIAKAVESLRLLGDNHLKLRFEAALKALQLPVDGIFDVKLLVPERLDALVAALDEVDPDNDADAARSPFSMVS